jgi:hypothetical protein
MHMPVVKALLKAGADPDKKDKAGRSVRTKVESGYHSGPET